MRRLGAFRLSSPPGRHQAQFRRTPGVPRVRAGRARRPRARRCGPALYSRRPGADGDRSLFRGHQGRPPSWRTFGKRGIARPRLTCRIGTESLLELSFDFRRPPRPPILHVRGRRRAPPCARLRRNPSNPPSSARLRDFAARGQLGGDHQSGRRLHQYDDGIAFTRLISEGSTRWCTFSWPGACSIPSRTSADLVLPTGAF